ncbi:hypothetical protein, partial [Psychroserpens sp.]|uniref:hypothetical protein n=1 Tax=Psychroserpens sp. TaxID=2020870 RepID=UPI003C788CF7
MNARLPYRYRRMLQNAFLAVVLLSSMYLAGQNLDTLNFDNDVKLIKLMQPTHFESIDSLF